MFYALIEKLRMLKIDPAHRGIMYITAVLEGRQSIDDLNDDQIQLIVDAWDSRNYIPEDLYKKMSKKDSNNVVKPENTEGLSREKYYRQVAANVIDFFRG